MAGNNVFTKTETVKFDELVAGYEDALEISEHVSLYGIEGELAERSNDTIWRPVPKIITSKDRTIGTPVTALDTKQLAVPASLGFKKVVPWQLSATEMRDDAQETSLFTAASQRLASDINTAIRDVVSLEGTMVVATSGAAGDYDDLAEIESLMDELGVMQFDRKLGINTRDWNGMAGNLASRTLMQDSVDALRRSRVGVIANLETFKIASGLALGANAASITIPTNGAQVRYVPLSSESTTNGEINVDNRTQQVTVSSTTGVTAGDCYTVAGISAMHHITKQSTGRPKTFRVISIDDGTTMTVSPPMVGANSSPTDPELAYQNVSVDSTSATAAITFLNLAATTLNPFWHKDSIELLVGRYSVPTNQGAAVIKSTTKQGLEVVMTKQFTANSYESAFFVDTFFGTVNKNPEMNGVQFFGQA
jgi:hypothetical protein